MNSSLSKYLSASIEKHNEANTNESLILGAIVATTCLTYAVAPVLNTDFMKSVGAGIGSLLNGIGNLFGGFNIGGSRDDIKELLKKDPDDLTGKEKNILKKASNNKRLQKDLSNNELKALEKALGKLNSDSDEDDSNINSAADITPGLLMMAKKANENEKDEAKKSKNNSLIDIITASVYDENGDIIPVEKRAEKMKSIIGEGWEDFKSKMEKKIKDDENSDEFKKALENAKNDITDKDIESFMTEAKENAKKTHERITKEKNEQEKLDKQIEEIENKLKETETEEDTKKLKEELENIKKEKDDLSKKSLVNQIKETDDTTEPKETDDTTEPKETDDTTEPKDYTDEEIENIQNELSDLNPETDKDKIKEKEDLLKSIAKAKGKNEDEFIPKETEVTDPDTGKKIKRVVHTGPKGGRFYYPDGKPKTPEHKVYVQESKYLNLSEHLNKELIINESLAIATTLAAASTTVTSKRMAMLFINKIIKYAKKYIKISFKIFNDLNMKDKINILNKNSDVLEFIKNVVTDKNVGLDDPKDIAIVTAIILAIWYITKWNKSKTEKYLKDVDDQLYIEIKSEISY